MLFRSFLVAAATFAITANAWLPNDAIESPANKRNLDLFTEPKRDGRGKRWLQKRKVRGVNLGSLFIFEPWISSKEWANTGCSGQNSEFNCVLNRGQTEADAAFKAHRERWVNSTDFDEMVSYGLNTVRIPLGYWLKESLVDSTEHFPKGGFEYLTKVCGWASDRGFYIILDLHGAPGAQEPNQPFTGKYVSTVGFYDDTNYNRAVEWIEWIANISHTTHEFRNVGMIELMNEPLQGSQAVTTLRSSYYPDAYKAIRNVEDKLSVPKGSRFHVQMMGSAWGSGNPVEYLDDPYFVSFDDHRYLKWDTSIEVSQSAYIKESCSDDRNVDGATIVGEWSISVPDDVADNSAWSPDSQKAFYKKWFAAQVHSYEKYTVGWVFWTWKTDLGSDYRWSYRDAVAAGVIPQNLDDLESVC